MNEEKSFALLVDVDNLPLDADGVFSIINQVKSKGELAWGKIYGYSDKKHKGMHELISRYGFEMTGPAKGKRRGKSTVDNRMFIDAVELACTNENIDAVCFVSGDGDLVPLFSKLKELGLYIVGGFRDDPENEDMCHETIAIDGSGFSHKAAKPRPQHTIQHQPVRIAHPSPAKQMSLRERMGEQNDKMFSSLPISEAQANELENTSGDVFSEVDRMIADFIKENGK